MDKATSPRPLRDSPKSSPARTKSGGLTSSRSRSKLALKNSEISGSQEPTPSGQFDLNSYQINTTTYSNREMLLLHKIFTLLVDKRPQILKDLFFFVSTPNQDALASVFMNLSFTTRLTLPFLEKSIQQEFETHPSVGACMKETCFASKLVKSYLAKIGEEYLVNLLTNYVNSVISDGKKLSKKETEPYDIDPHRVSDHSKAQANATRLSNSVNNLLSQVTSAEAIDRMPTGIRIVAQYFDNESRRYLPEPDDRFTLAGALLFLRFINPVIAAPYNWEAVLKNQKKLKKVSESLVMVTRVLLALAGNPKDREACMKAISSFLDDKRPVVTNYFDAIIDVQFNPSTVHVDYPINASSQDYHIFHALLCQYSADIHDDLKDTDDRAAFKDMIDKLGEAKDKFSINNLGPAGVPIKSFLQSRMEAAFFVGACETFVKTQQAGAILVIATNKIFLLKAKDGKPLAEHHHFDLQKLESPDPTNLTFHFQNGITLAVTTQHADAFIDAMQRAHMFIFPAMPAPLRFEMAVTPATRVHTHIIKHSEVCGGLAVTYAALSRYYDLPVNPVKVATIKHIQETGSRTYLIEHETVLPDKVFSDRQYLAVFHALAYNNYITKLHIRCMRFGQQVLQGLVTLFATNFTITHCYFNDVCLVLGKEKAIPLPGGWSNIFEAMTSNKQIAISALQVNNCFMDERDVAALAAFLAATPTEMIKLSIAQRQETFDETKYTPFKATTKLLESIVENSKMYQKLTHLHLVRQNFSASDLQILQLLKALPKLEDLDLSNTRLNAVNRVFTEGLQHLKGSLRKLNVSSQRLNPKEGWKEVVTWLQQPGALEHADISDTQIPISCLNEILVSTRNQQLVLVASQNDYVYNDMCLVALVEAKFKFMSKIVLNDNIIGDEGISQLCRALYANPTVRTLHIDRCLRFLTFKARKEMIEDICDLLNAGNVTNFSLSGHPIKVDLRLKEVNGFFEGLMNNKTLKILDISGHQMGNCCALAVSRFLEVNNTLAELIWDDNNTSPLGLRQFAKSLESNDALEVSPLPLSDISKVLFPPSSPERLAFYATLEQIEAKILINQKNRHYPFF